MCLQIFGRKPFVMNFLQGAICRNTLITGYLSPGNKGGTPRVDRTRQNTESSEDARLATHNLR